MELVAQPIAELEAAEATRQPRKKTIKQIGATLLSGIIAWGTLALNPNQSTPTYQSSKLEVLQPNDNTQPGTVHSLEFPDWLQTHSSESHETTTTNPPTTTIPAYPQAVQEYLWGVQAAAANADGKYDSLANCETGGNWQMHGSKYSGGLGFLNAAWTDFRLPSMPYNAGEASQVDQIVVAERIRWETQPSGSWAHGKWGCAPRVGLP